MPGHGAHDHADAIADVVRALADGVEPERAPLAEAVRALAFDLGERYGGRTIEVRVPPFAAVQLRSATGEGPQHHRGTPPNVVETDPATFVLLATGALRWDDAVARHRLRWSGAHAHDVATMLPLAALP
ncbi:MAG: sterol carrier family protein [Propionibacteriaceae bacterium]|nr:sterol carrier family protein [Propionibacteriaceae bacterium]